MTRLVIDNSVIVKWFYEEEDSDKALDLLQKIESGQFELNLPSLAVIELINSLKFGKKEKTKETIEVVDKFFKLEPRLIEVNKKTAFEISNLTQVPNLTAFDALYIAVADQQRILLFTADYKHHKKSISGNIIWLSEWNGKI